MPFFDRRAFLEYCSAAGLGGTLFPGALVAAENRTETAAPVVAALSAAVLVLFGIYFLYDAAMRFAA